MIPHRHPFLMIDKVVDVVANQRATGVKNVSINEYYFQGHFPARPVMPGVLIIEAMAQTAAVLVVHTLGPGIGGQARLFHERRQRPLSPPGFPGDRLDVHVTKQRNRGNSSLSYSSAFSNCSRSSVAACRMSSTLVWLANRSPSRLSSSAESRASPSPTRAMASSSASSSASRAQSTAPPPARRADGLHHLVHDQLADPEHRQRHQRARHPQHQDAGHVARLGAPHQPEQPRHVPQRLRAASRQPGSGASGFRPPRLGRTIGCCERQGHVKEANRRRGPDAPLDWRIWPNALLAQPGRPRRAGQRRPIPVSLVEKVVRPVVVYLLLVFALRTVGQADAGPAQPVRLRGPAHAVEHGAERHHRERHVARWAASIGAARAARRSTRCWSGSTTAGPSMQQLAAARAGVCLIEGGQLQRGRDAAAPHQRRRAHRPRRTSGGSTSWTRSRPPCSIPTARSISAAASRSRAESATYRELSGGSTRSAPRSRRSAGRSLDSRDADRHHRARHRRHPRDRPRHRFRPGARRLSAWACAPAPPPRWTPWWRSSKPRASPRRAPPADVGEPEQVVRARSARSAEALGEIGLLVNNAGVLIARPFEELTLEDWDTTMAHQPAQPLPRDPGRAPRDAPAARGHGGERREPGRPERLRRRHGLHGLQARRARLRPLADARGPEGGHPGHHRSAPARWTPACCATSRCSSPIPSASSGPEDVAEAILARRPASRPGPW